MLSSYYSYFRVDSGHIGAQFFPAHFYRFQQSSLEKSAAKLSEDGVLTPLPTSQCIEDGVIIHFQNFLGGGHHLSV